MLRQTITLALGLWAGAHAQALDLIIPAGGEYQIEKSELVLERLRLDEGAKLTLAPNISKLHLRADQVWIAEGAVLDFSGREGKKGESPLAMAKQEQYCKPGAQGAPGQKGGDGQAAPEVHLELSFIDLKASKILLTGGNGGAGGNGAQGQAGGDAYQCRGGAGGQGGHGGTGGNGGAGGKLIFSYQSQAGMNVAELIDISVAAGLAGPAGLAGVGGNGGEGRYAKMGGRNAKKWLAGGAVGLQGENAAVGKAGINGQLVLEQKLANLQTASKPQLKGDDKTLRALLARMRQLELRVEALEKAKK